MIRRFLVPSAATIFGVLMLSPLAKWAGSSAHPESQNENDDISIQRVTSVSPNPQGIRFAANNPANPLVISSDVLFMTYVGGTTDQIGTGVAFDSEGNLIVSGTTSSDDFPVVNAAQGNLAGGADIFVAKIDPVTGEYLFSTFIGGSSSDAGSGLAIDAADRIHVCGSSISDDFPTMDALQAESGGGRDAVYFRLSSDGVLEYSTYLGGSAVDRCTGLAVSEGGEVVLGGYTESDDFPLQNALQAARSGDEDSFVAKLNASGDALVYSTYIGGTARDRLREVDVDAEGNAVVTGETQSGDFPTRSAVQEALAGGRDGFVTKLNASGDQLVYSTYLGGSANDFASGVAFDSDGNAHVAGTTASDDFPTENAVMPEFAGGQIDGFVTKFDPGGTVLYSTYVGGPGGDAIRAVDIDEFGATVLVGFSDGLELPIAGKSRASSTFDDPAVIIVMLPSGEPIRVFAVGGEIYTEWFAVGTRDGQVAITGDREAGAPGISTDGSEPVSSSSYDMLAGIIQMPPLSDRTVLAVDKVPASKTVELYTPLEWTLTVTNQGDQTAENVVAKDRPSEDLRVNGVKDQVIEWQIGNLAAGQTWTMLVDSRPEDTSDGNENTIIAEADNAGRVFKRVSVEILQSPMDLIMLWMGARPTGKRDLGAVDLYLDDQLVADDLEEGSAVPLASIELGDVDPSLDVVASTDLDNSVPLFSIPISLVMGDSVDAALSTGVGIVLYSLDDDSLGVVMNKELKVASSGPDHVEFFVANASAETIDVWVRSATAGLQHVFDDLDAGATSAYASFGPEAITIVMRSADGTEDIAALEFDLSDHGGDALVVAFNLTVDGPVMEVASLSGTMLAGRVVTSSDRRDDLPESFRIVGSYPNPTQGEATISFDLPATADVFVELFDIQGRSVIRSGAKQVTAGAGRVVSLTADRLPSGTYFYRLVAKSGADRWVTSGDMVVVR